MSSVDDGPPLRQPTDQKILNSKQWISTLSPFLSLQSVESAMDDHEIKDDGWSEVPALLASLYHVFQLGPH